MTQDYTIDGLNAEEGYKVAKGLESEEQANDLIAQIEDWKEGKKIVAQEISKLIKKEAMLDRWIFEANISIKTFQNKEVVDEEIL